MTLSHKRILSQLGSARKALTVKEVSEAVNLSRSHSYGTLKDLQAEGLAKPSPNDRRPARWGITCDGYARYLEEE